MKQWWGQKETLCFDAMTMIVLLMILSCVAVESRRNETLAEHIRRRPGIPPKFLGYTALSSIEPGENPPYSALCKGRKRINECVSLNPFLTMEVDTEGPLADVQNVTVTVRGVLNPDENDWIAVMPSSESNFIDNCPYVKLLYLETGDTQELPLLCKYPVKFQHIGKADSQYLNCKNSECQKKLGGFCLAKTCTGSITFRLINIRSDVIFVFFGYGLIHPCILLTSKSLSFANPLSPLHGHLSSVNSAADSMRVTWVSGDYEPQSVIYGYNNYSVTSSVTTFQQSDLCDTDLGPATGFGWHDPGFIHTAVLTRLLPSTSYEYQYGSEKAGWSKRNKFRTPPAAGDSEVKFIMLSDMGKNERDSSNEHYLQEGALDVIDAVAKEVDAGGVAAIFHTGDISYATGFLVEWDAFLEMINPVASRVPYMTATGNHERDFPGSGSVYPTPDSGGECGVPYETYFQMPSQGPDKPWYSVEYGPIHFTVMSTEVDWTCGSEQFTWLEKDLASVNRSRTPWVIFSGHRPLYSSAVADSLLSEILRQVDSSMMLAIEPLLVQYKVDIATWGHVHQYERTCSMQNWKCVYKPTKNIDGIDTYSSSSYAGPIHVIIGMSGFRLDEFVDTPADWSLVRISKYGYTRFHATHDLLQCQLVLARNGIVADQFELLRSPSSKFTESNTNL
ncbi:hypothetical protein M758_7G139800 [Ceratodon purpureus]|uniref:Purple acid phosphatase n=1 Tax=Ceratodon purpureus TaxID=3225 RepID=A0A8T0HA01_CERPU|nr:hypothetical protein KC19_7G138500 [Ceratodon purpureus]KAG0611419.1 hypothetical protein M758_7G139800 [Ceratodon purpureus]